MDDMPCSKFGRVDYPGSYARTHYRGIRSARGADCSTVRRRRLCDRLERGVVKRRCGGVEGDSATLSICSLYLCMVRVYRRESR